MEEAKSRSLEEDFEGQATHTGKQIQKEKKNTRLKLNVDVSKVLTDIIQYEI